MTVAVLSPHFDDAVLSCWHVLGAPGPVRVVNVFAGVPADDAAPGRPMEIDDATPDVLADAIVAEIGRSVRYRPIAPGGARRAAEAIAETLVSPASPPHR